MKRGRMQFRRSSFWREAFGLCLAAVLVLGLSISAAAGPIVDRVVANVNGHVVLQSDWEEEVSFEAFEDGKDPATFTDAERKAALDRLIDQELLREQVRPSQPAPPIRWPRGWRRCVNCSRMARPMRDGMRRWLTAG